MRRMIGAMKGKTEVAKAFIQAVGASLINLVRRGSSPQDRGDAPTSAGQTPSSASFSEVTTRARTKAGAANQGAEEAQRAIMEEPDQEERLEAGVTVPEQYIPRQVMTELMEGETEFLSQPSQRLEELICGLQTQDQLYQSHSAKVRQGVGKYKGYTMDANGTLVFKGRLVIPAQQALRTEILADTIMTLGQDIWELLRQLN